MNHNETLPPGSVPVQLGEVLAGKYRVDRILGAGGMGVVVAATHLQLDQKVALKFMLPAALAHPALVERFAREARAAVRLKSDHVARVLDVGTLESGSPYMVMEFLEGSDIATIIESHGPMPAEMAVDYVLQTCDAVAEAHALGIIHRDLKPRNLFVTHRNDGRAVVKVLDFGISKQTGINDLNLTRTTEIMGSPNYMSPEQLRSARAVDERSDIWALGVILYELLTGHVPFRAESVTQLTAMVLMESPRPIGEMRPDLPPGLVKLVEHCLQKEPANRFGNVAELAAALEPYAPADMRQLAMRIARIGGGPGSRLSGTPPAPMSAKIAVAGGGTAVTWSGHTELATTARTRKRRMMGIAVIGSLSGVALGAVIFFGIMRHGRASDPGPPSAPAGASTPVATASAPPAAPPSTDAPSATAATTTTAASSATPVTTTTTTGTAKTANPGTGPAHAHADAGSYEPPRNRTSW